MAESEYKRGYSRGYNAARGPNWPEHKPPLPPHEMCRDILKAARELRDIIDSELAVFDEDDEWNVKVGPYIDALDQEFMKLGFWLRREDGTEASETCGAVQVVRPAP